MQGRHQVPHKLSIQVKISKNSSKNFNKLLRLSVGWYRGMDPLGAADTWEICTHSQALSFRLHWVL